MQFAAITNAWLAFVIPLIVLLYLFKRNYVNTTISSHLLWDRALKDMEAVRPWQRLRSPLLLIIQLLIASLFVFALMEPLFQLAKQPEAHVIFVIDRSASMQALLPDMKQVGSEEKSRYDEAISQVERWMGERKADAYTVIVTGEPPVIALHKKEDASAVIKAMKEFELHYGDSHYGETLALATALAENEGDATIVIVSDGLWSNVHAEYDSFVDAPIEWLPIKDEGSINLAIVRFGVSRVNTGEEEQVYATAFIRNASRQHVNTTLTLYGDDRFIEQMPLSIEALEEQAIYFRNLPIAETYQLQIDTPDALQVDNVSYAFLTPNEKKTILFVGEPSFFMQQVLAVMDAETVYARLDENGRYAIPQGDLFNIDLIVLEQVEHSRIDTEEWKQLLDQKPVWLLDTYPLDEEAEEVVLMRSDSQKRIEVREHPLTRYVSWTHPFVNKAYVPAQTPWPYMEPLVLFDGIPLVYAGLYQGVPKLMHTFILSDSDFPLRAEFPVWTAQAIDWLSDTQKEHLPAAMAGTIRSIPFSLDTESYRWVRLGMDGGSVESTLWNPVVTNEIVMPAIPGLYALVERNASGMITKQRKVFVYMNEEESKLQQTPLWESREGPQQESDLSEQNDLRTIRTHYRDLLPLWIGIILLLLLIEWEVYQRGHSF